MGLLLQLAIMLRMKMILRKGLLAMMYCSVIMAEQDHLKSRNI